MQHIGMHVAFTPEQSSQIDRLARFWNCSRPEAVRRAVEFAHDHVYTTENMDSHGHERT